MCYVYIHRWMLSASTAFLVVQDQIGAKLHLELQIKANIGNSSVSRGDGEVNQPGAGEGITNNHKRISPFSFSQLSFLHQVNAKRMSFRVLSPTK
jgi:hypothetical protein